MDEYLQCLYNYIMETRRDETLMRTYEYRKRRTAMLTAMHFMEATLTEEQRKTVDSYLSLQSKLTVMESDWLFQEGVALGRWMANA